MSVTNNLKRNDPPPEVDLAPISRQRKISYNEPLQLQPLASEKESMEKALPSSPKTEPSHSIFPHNVAKPVFRKALPKLGQRFSSTLQLAFAHHLLSMGAMSSPTTLGQLCTTRDETQHLVLDEEEQAWTTFVENDPIEQAHIQWLTAQTASEFLSMWYKTSDAVAEIVLLGSVMERKDYRNVLSSFVGQLQQTPFLDISLHERMVHLLQMAPPVYLSKNELIRILHVLRRDLTDICPPVGDTEHAVSDSTYHLVEIISRVLDTIVEGRFGGLRRTDGYQPLSDLLDKLKSTIDPYLRFQVEYASQALQYVGDDESLQDAALRVEGGLAMNVTRAAGASELDTGDVLEGVDTQARDRCEDADDVQQKDSESRATLAWFPAIHTARVFVREGRLADFKRIIFEAPCQHEPEFQHGICVILGEMAIDSIWETDTRRQAINLMVELYRSDLGWIVNDIVERAILRILVTVSKRAEQTIQDLAKTILQELTNNGACPLPEPYLMMNRFQHPTASSVFDKVLNLPCVEHDLHRFKNLRLADYDQAVYVPPEAKAELQASNDDSFPLMTKVVEFLESEQQVFLIIGDSGSGKSTFNRYLEDSLWRAYKDTSHIPLLISLPALGNPEKELIQEHLRMHDFSESSIQELKQHRQFIIICDGYDEARLNRNLHSTNCFNRPGQWAVKMIVSCRSTHIRKDHHSRFIPQPVSSYKSPSHHLYQEATIVPFSRSQIKDYVEQFVRDEKVHGLFIGRPVWGAEEYLEKLEKIPNLMGLAKNPFLLTLSLMALPTVVMHELELSGTTATRSKLYKTFIDQWLDINLRRLTAMKLSEEARVILEDLIDDGFNKVAIQFLQDLAAAMYKNQEGTPVVHYNHRRDESTWKAKFFGPKWDVTLLRESSPLTRINDQHRFLHRSFLEYFYACHVSRATRSHFKDYTDYTQRNSSSSPSSSLNQHVSLSSSSQSAHTRPEPFVYSRDFYPPSPPPSPTPQPFPPTHPPASTSISWGLWTLTRNPKSPSFLPRERRKTTSSARGYMPLSLSLTRMLSLLTTKKRSETPTGFWRSIGGSNALSKYLIYIYIKKEILPECPTFDRFLFFYFLPYFPLSLPFFDLFPGLT